MRDFSGWIEFFTRAGIPQTVQKTYAQIFIDHRITDSVVPDLDKDHLKDMGITVIGDIISILKQCKKVGHETPDVAVPKVTSTTPQQLSILNDGVPVRRRMTKEIEGNYVVKRPTGNTPKTQKILSDLKNRSNFIGEERNSLQGSNGLSSFKYVPDSSSVSRIVIAKQPPAPPPKVSNSVFDRLGGDPNSLSTETATPAVTTSTQKTEVFQRIIRNNLPGSVSMPPDSSSHSASPVSPKNFGLNFTVTKRVSVVPNKGLAIPPSNTAVVAGVKRQSTERSVFSRLSSGCPSEAASSSQPTYQLLYNGVLKTPSPSKRARLVPSPSHVELRSGARLSGGATVTTSASVARRPGPLSSTAVATKPFGSAHSKPPVHSRLG